MRVWKQMSMKEIITNTKEGERGSRVPTHKPSAPGNAREYFPETWDIY